MSTLNILQIRKRLGKDYWEVPKSFGPDGWSLDATPWEPGRFGRGPLEGARIIVTASDFTSIGAPAGEQWIHASISRNGFMPTYDDLVNLHKAVWPDGYAYQVFAPPSQHVNLHTHALHLWGKFDGSAVLPEFGKFGTI
jgi:hypothetical protein